MRRNYDTKLSGEIITGNYELVYYVAENVEIIGILAYPKIHEFCPPFSFNKHLAGEFKIRLKQERSCLCSFL